MAFNFHANQFEKTFHPVSLQNWQIPNEFGRMPRRRAGTTEIIASNRGHLSTGVPRSRISPWGTFVGTWDMPNKLPGIQMTNFTARSENAMEKLLRCKTEGDLILSGKLKKSRVPQPLPIRPDIEAGQTGDLLPQRSPSTVKSGSGVRSGARNPTPKPDCTQPDTVDNLHWPCPDNVPCEEHGSGSRQQRRDLEARDNLAVSPSQQEPNTQSLQQASEPEIGRLVKTPDGVEWPLKTTLES
ncbi:protein Flattop homolog [Gigantopelta aegis]|uniref:protein Flattop homolog n=1 Tax=Gigantopelta aegis TaxID=1735272 RepID=UPI001B88DE2D|nr:protein Flattop homolog [Gigantopelta aegis]